VGRALRGNQVDLVGPVVHRLGPALPAAVVVEKVDRIGRRLGPREVPRVPRHVALPAGQEQLADGDLLDPARALDLPAGLAQEPQLHVVVSSRGTAASTISAAVPGDAATAIEWSAQSNPASGDPSEARTTRAWSVPGPSAP